MSELTTADAFALETASKNTRNRTDDYDISRWSKKGDRLYLNGVNKFEKASVYVDLETGTIEDLPSSRYDTSVTVDGDTLTVEITEDRFRTKTWTYVIAIDGENFESDEDDEDSEQRKVATDGGEDVSSNVDDTIIEDAIAQHDDPDHPDALSIDDVRELLAHIQRDTEAVWGEWLDNIERGDSEIVGQTDDWLILDTGEHDTVSRALETYTGPVTVDDIAEHVVSTVHHRVAEQAAPEHDWGVTYPRAVAKTDDYRAGERATMLEIAGRTAEYGSVARAVDSLATDEHGWGKSEWARLTDRNPSTVSRTTDN